jgi:hypothetical protein
MPNKHMATIRGSDRFTSIASNSPETLSRVRNLVVIIEGEFALL